MIETCSTLDEPMVLHALNEHVAHRLPPEHPDYAPLVGKTEPPTRRWWLTPPVTLQPGEHTLSFAADGPVIDGELVAAVLDEAAS